MLMKIFIVQFIYTFYVCFANYCEICANHTLCLYAAPGPSKSCTSYDANASLSKYEIKEILNAINERRNFVGMGLSNLVPQAANMKKMVWSSELATSAQRWVDQCDSAIRPDKEDECRDLAHAKVGQNIATILGPAPGVQIKSFVEMWFISILKYQGSVLYYNQSQDHRTNYFTQLIWAETEFVGCGKARFYLARGKTKVERLVCNFAPKGNILGKPIYTLGYSNTQCPNNMTRDEVFQGLCRQDKNQINNDGSRQITTFHPPASSLLRILNLSNSSMKQDIDPLRNYLKQINCAGNKTNEQRFQKMRHVFFNDTDVGVKRTATSGSRKFWNIGSNHSHKHNGQVEKGHSRVYHGYEIHVNDHDSHTKFYDSYAHIQKENNEYFRKYDFITESININTDGDIRKHNINSQCTRKQHLLVNNCKFKDCPAGICTREGKCNICSQPTTSYPPSVYYQRLCSNVREKASQCNNCKCIEQTTICQSVSECCNVNCRCRNTGCPLPCQNARSIDSSDGFNYDILPKIDLRSGDQKSTATYSNTLSWSLSSIIFDKFLKKSNRRKNYDNYYRQVKDVIKYTALNLQDHYYSDNYFDSSERKKRELENQITFKPFWQMDKLNYKKPSELKSIRYTTFPMRRNRKPKKTTHDKKTEVITISIKEFASNNTLRKRITEKYLSFEELMHLRKITATNDNIDGRRKVSKNIDSQKETAKAKDVTIATTTPEYTINTRFIRKKHCTRKLTCTWTAFAITGADGNTLNPGGGPLDHGSRTPPGYVEGCSRTSTCTREFMDRNQMATVTEEGEPIASGNDTSLEDEDYCERRSLNIRRRDCDPENFVIDSTTEHQEIYSDALITQTESLPTINSCFWNKENLRIKREKFNFLHGLELAKQYTKKNASYSDLFYISLKKPNNFSKNNIKSNNQMCSSSSVFSKFNFVLILFTFLLYLF